jgi:hypothetical protein
VIVVIDSDQVSELQMPRQTSCFARNALLCTSVPEEDICVIVDYLEPRFIESCCGIGLSNGETDGVGKSLAKRASGDLDSRGVMGFRMSWRNAIQRLDGSQLAAAHR